MKTSIKIRPTEEKDIDFVIEAERDRQNSPFVDQWDYSRHRDSLLESQIRHLIIENSEGKYAGYIILDGMSGKNRAAELKRLVITQKGQGYGRQVIKRVQKMVFDDMGFHRLWLDVRDYNERAIHLYESCGFIKEGHLRECVHTEKGFASIYIMGQLSREYTP